MEIETLDNVKIDEFIEVFVGKLYILNEDGDEEDVFTPAELSIKFMLQNDFESHCGLKHEDKILRIHTNHMNELINYKDDFLRTLSVIDDYLVTDRKTMFEICRIPLPTFAIMHEDGEIIEIEAFATFFKKGYFTITYIYKNVAKTLCQDNLNNIELWTSLKYILMDELLIDKLKIDLRNADITQINKRDKENERLLIGVGRNDLEEFDLLSTKISFMMEFIVSYLSEEKVFIYSRIYKNNYRFYCLSSKNNDSKDNFEIESTIIRARKVIERRPKSYIYNDKVHDSFVDISVNENCPFKLNNSLCIIFDLEKGLVAGEDLLNKEQYQLNICQAFALIEFYLSDYVRLMEVASKLKMRLYEELNKEDLYKVKTELLDIQSDFNVFNFGQIEAVTLSDTIKQVFKIDQLNMEFNNLYKKVEYISQMEKSIHDDRELKIKEKANYLFQLIALIISIPAITQVIDLVYDIFYFNDSIYWQVNSLIKLGVFLLILYIVLYLSYKNKQFYKTVSTCKDKLWLLILSLIFICFFLFSGLSIVGNRDRILLEETLKSYINNVKNNFSENNLLINIEDLNRINNSYNIKLHTDYYNLYQFNKLIRITDSTIYIDNKNKLPIFQNSVFNKFRKLDGSITDKNKRITKFQISLLKINGNWKIINIDLWL